ncbi:hypothetical protein MED121_18630 [Marinomonas sp. MED121]|uniref:alpha/beta hydrolase family protein n=1 Tax=Marinomonas sp. MED121 TaxID=314277 RepID=UPI0000690D68|nr:dienelactone hydrolase [Marinomonas sp. MED121]EAQ65285.1 hypothetical protein MED121_18630 [Marinomonas sp. MED121]
MNNLIDIAQHLPVSKAEQTISISPVLIESSRRPHPLELRITAPVKGENLPVVLFSHGDGPSLYLPSKDGYGPLVNFYAEHGFVVIQPTHANSKVAGFDSNKSDAPLFWRERVNEMKLILDELENIESGIPALKGRINHQNIAAVGHSMGGQTVGMLLGAHLTDSRRIKDRDVSTFEPRIKVGVLLAAPGKGGDSLSEFARTNFTELNPDFRYLKTQALSVVGDADNNTFMSIKGPEWYTDPFKEAPGIDLLLTLHGAKHGLGGIAGYDAKETSDESPDTLAATQRLTWAYLKSAFDSNDFTWEKARNQLAGPARSLGHITDK